MPLGPSNVGRRTQTLKNTKASPHIAWPHHGECCDKRDWVIGKLPQKGRTIGYATDRNMIKVVGCGYGLGWEVGGRSGK